MENRAAVVRSLVDSMEVLAPSLFQLWKDGISEVKTSSWCFKHRSDLGGKLSKSGKHCCVEVANSDEKLGEKQVAELLGLFLIWRCLMLVHGDSCLYGLFLSCWFSVTKVTINSCLQKALYVDLLMCIKTSVNKNISPEQTQWDWCYRLQRLDVVRLRLQRQWWVVFPAGETGRAISHHPFVNTEF